MRKATQVEIYGVSAEKLYNAYYRKKTEAEQNGGIIFPAWKDRFTFYAWLKENGFRKGSRIIRKHNYDFTPDNLEVHHSGENSPFEYIAYLADDPYELPIATATSAYKLSEIVRRMGYHYDAQSIFAQLVRVEDGTRNKARQRGYLCFEKVDLRDYQDD